MRSGTRITVPITVSGRMIETPRLIYDKDIIVNNNELCISTINTIEATLGIKHEYDKNVNAYIWKDVPKEVMLDLIRGFKCHPWNLNFQPIAIADYIENNPELDKWDVGIPLGRDNEYASTYDLFISDKTIHIVPENRKLEKGKEADHLLRVSGTHVRIGSGGCTKIGLDSGKIEYAKEHFRINGKVTDRTYLREELERKPIALIHIMKNTKKEETPDLPEHIFGLGLGFPGGEEEKTATYVVNTKELENYIDVDEADDND